MAVSMLKDLDDKNNSVETIAMDGDTTTKAMARKEMNASLKKKSYANDAQKHFTNKLYGLLIAKKIEAARDQNHFTLEKVLYLYHCNEQEKSSKFKIKLESTKTSLFLKPQSMQQKLWLYSESY